MSSIVILAASFIAALIGIIRDNRAKPGEKSIFGLNLLGAVLLGLSITGATAALVQEVQSLRTKNDVAQELRRLADTIKDPNVKQALTEASSRLGSMKFARGEHAAIPPWVPIYPGIQPEDVRERRDQNGWSGSYAFIPILPPRFFEWYRDRLRDDGFTITTDDVKFIVGGRLVAQDPSGRRRITLSHPHALRAEVLWEERNR